MSVSRRLLRAILPAFLLALAAAAADGPLAINTESHKELPSNEITALIPEADGGMWVCTMAGLARWQDGKLTNEPVLYGGKPAKLGVWDVFRDGDRLWLGHEQGGSVIADGKQVHQDHLQCAVARYVRMDQARLWCVATQGDQRQVQAYEDGVWRQLLLVNGRITALKPAARKTGDDGELTRPAATGAAGARIVDLYVAPDQRVWLTVDGDGVIEVDPAKGLERYTHHLRQLNVTAVYRDRAGTMWAGLWARGVARFDGKDWQMMLENKLKRCAVMRIREDATGAILAATNARGVWRLPKGATDWTCELEDAGSVTLLEVTRDGRVWLGAQGFGGLKVWDGKAWQVGLASQFPVRCLAEDKDGRIWIGGVLDGVHVLPAK